MTTTSHPPRTREPNRRPTPATRSGRAELRHRASRRRRWGWAAAAAALAVVVAGLVSANGPTSRLTSGVAPDFSLEATDGGRVSLASLRGRAGAAVLQRGRRLRHLLHPEW